MADKVAPCPPTRWRSEGAGTPVKFILERSANPQVPLLDSIVPKTSRCCTTSSYRLHSPVRPARSRRCRTQQGHQVAEPLIATRARRSRRPHSTQWLWGLALRAARGGSSSARSSSIRSGSSSSTRSRAGTATPTRSSSGRATSRRSPGPDFLDALRNNVFFALSVPVQLVVPLCLAFLIHERIRGWRFFRWTYFLPAIYSTVVLGVLTRLVLQAGRAVEPGRSDGIGLGPGPRLAGRRLDGAAARSCWSSSGRTSATTSCSTSPA